MPTLARMRQLMGKLKLTVNEEKTRSCKVPEGGAATFLIRAWLPWVTGRPQNMSAVTAAFFASGH
jgi:hypothetical protein